MITTAPFDARSFWRRLATSSVKYFSYRLPIPIEPGSRPPWPASKTITLFDKIWPVLILEERIVCCRGRFLELDDVLASCGVDLGKSISNDEACCFHV